MALDRHRVVPSAGDGELHVAGAGAVFLPTPSDGGAELAELVAALEPSTHGSAAFRAVVGWILSHGENVPDFSMCVQTANGVLVMTSGAGVARVVDGESDELVKTSIPGDWAHRFVESDVSLVLGDGPTSSPRRIDLRLGTVPAGGAALLVGEETDAAAPSDSQVSIGDTPVQASSDALPNWLNPTVAMDAATLEADADAPAATATSADDAAPATASPSWAPEADSESGSGARPTSSGSWAHAEPSAELPDWVSQGTDGAPQVVLGEVPEAAEGAGPVSRYDTGEHASPADVSVESLDVIDLEESDLGDGDGDGDDPVIATPDGGDARVGETDSEASFGLDAADPAVAPAGALGEVDADVDVEPEGSPIATPTDEVEVFADGNGDVEIGGDAERGDIPEATEAPVADEADKVTATEDVEPEPELEPEAEPAPERANHGHANPFLDDGQADLIKAALDSELEGIKSGSRPGPHVARSATDAEGSLGSAGHEGPPLNASEFESPDLDLARYRRTQASPDSRDDLWMQMTSDANEVVVAPEAGAPPTGPRPTTNPDLVVSDSRATSLGEVIGKRCANGHLNAPVWLRCGTCGIDLTGAGAGRGPHPGLGAIVFDDGSEVELTTGYLLGRRPSPAAIGEPDLVAVAITDDSQSVSRNHAILSIDGWELLITDCGSANGTLVEMNGEYLTLQPNSPYTLAAGQRVMMGTRWFRYAPAGMSPASEAR